MTKTSYDPKLTMRQARAQYFAVNRFGDDGGYHDAWVDFKLGPLPLPFPNSPARIKALRFHDLHHIVTDYDTDTLGEFEISAWELGAGCRNFAAAWVLNLGGLAAGLLSAPRRTMRAFLRGRRSRTLYGRTLEDLLDAQVAEVRAMLTDPAPANRLLDGLLLSLGAVAGVLLGAMLLILMVALLPLFFYFRLARPATA